MLQQVDFNTAVRKSSFTALGRGVSFGVAVLLLEPQQVTWALVLLMCVYHLLRYGSISYQRRAVSLQQDQVGTSLQLGFAGCTRPIFGLKINLYRSYGLPVEAAYA